MCRERLGAPALVLFEPRLQQVLLQALKLRVEDLGCGGWVSGFRVLGFGFRV